MNSSHFLFWAAIEYKAGLGISVAFNNDLGLGLGQVKVCLGAKSGCGVMSVLMTDRTG
jgi:hypothetical protein